MFLFSELKFFEFSKIVEFHSESPVLRGGMKTEKSPSADVWNHKIGLKRRAMLPFASDDRYDHKEACKHTQ